LPSEALCELLRAFSLSLVVGYCNAVLSPSGGILDCSAIVYVPSACFEDPGLIFLVDLGVKLEGIRNPGHAAGCLGAVGSEIQRRAICKTSKLYDHTEIFAAVPFLATSREQPVSGVCVACEKRIGVTLYGVPWIFVGCLRATTGHQSQDACNEYCGFLADTW
jgi:hypothetical protein